MAKKQAKPKAKLTQVKLLHGPVDKGLKQNITRSSHIQGTLKRFPTSGIRCAESHSVVWKL